VVGNESLGIAVTDLAGFASKANRVTENVATGNGLDLAFYASSAATKDAAGNCFAGNRFGSSLPSDIEAALPCGEGARRLAPPPRPRQDAAPPGISFRDVVPPPAQPTMADPEQPPEPAVGLPPKVELSDIHTPPRRP
jgi:hypothetical protein